jgi:hypothetical protein
MKKWPTQLLGDCVAPKELWNEGRGPRQRIKYVELAGIDKERGVIAADWLFATLRSDWFINQVVLHDEKNTYPSVRDAESESVSELRCEEKTVL